MPNRMIQPLNLITFLLTCNYFYTESAVTTDSIHFLNPDDTFNNDKPGLQIFCHSAKTKYIIHAWKSLAMDLNTNIDHYELYDGKSPEEVMGKYEDDQRSWRLNLLGTRKSRKFKMNPFQDSCIGIHVYSSISHRYTISLTETRIDVFQLTLTLLGVATYWSAGKLSRNPLFYYLCGITLGITTSTIILVYFASKLLLRGKIMYLTIAIGWTMSFYLLEQIWENAQLIALRYREWVMWFILVVSLVSFVICYWFGPVKNARTIKLIKWFLQIAGLSAVYYSSYFREVSFFCCVLNVLLYNFPVVMLRKGRNYWKNMFPERRRLLTEDQYRKEGIRETKKALNQLKEYCTSPECNPWKTILRLKDPIRFARFMEGESNFSDYELEEYDSEITRIVEECEYTDDEDDED